MFANVVDVGGLLSDRLLEFRYAEMFVQHNFSMTLDLPSIYDVENVVV